VNSFTVPIYSGTVCVYTSREEYSAAWKELEGDAVEDVDEMDGVSSRHSDKKKSSVYLIGVFDGDEGTLVHELVHTVFEMLSHAGIPISKRNDEVFAYLMAALYREALQAMKGASENPAA
jgi:hypothetical protein